MQCFLSKGVVIINKIVCFLCSLVVVFNSFLGISAKAEENSYIYVENLNEGVYNIDVKSSSSMFKIVNCDLNVSDGEMTAVMTLSGTGYEKLFMGTGEDAINVSDEEYIYFVEDSEGKYTYTVPVKALDMDIDCAAWSIRKQTWYDRVLVFKSDTLPEEAFAKSFNVMYVIILSAVLILVAAVVIIFVCVKKCRNRKSKNGD